jgi:hypothetical protein
VSKVYTIGLVLVVALACAVSVSADGFTLIEREDAIHGSPVSHTTAIITPQGVELWACTWNVFQCYEAGKLFPVKVAKGTALSVGGYASWWEKVGQAYLEPFVCASRKVGNWTASASVGAYVPLNGGTWVAFVPEASLTTKVSKRFSAGPALCYWGPAHGDTDFRVGGLANVSIGPDTSLTARYLVGVGPLEEDAARLQLSTAF